MTSAMGWKGVGRPRSYFEWPQHERPRTGEGITLTPSRDSGQALALSRRGKGYRTPGPAAQGWIPDYSGMTEGEGRVVCAMGCEGVWRGVGVSRFLPAQERRRGAQERRNGRGRMLIWLDVAIWVLHVLEGVGDGRSGTQGQGRRSGRL